MLGVPQNISTVDSWRKPLLEDVLRGIRPESGVAYWPEFRAPWGVSFKRDWAVFHIIVEGTCWLQVEGVAAMLELSAGDFAVVTQGRYHTMRDLPSTPAVNFADLVKTLAPGSKGDLRSGGDGRLTRLVCGGIEDRYGHPLMVSLPPILHIKGSDKRTPSWVRSTARHVRAELDGGGTGSIEVANRLVDILFLHAVRALFDESAETGWLAAAQDQQIGRALAAIHHKPHKSWTVESLARHVAMSRTSFAARFRELVGEPPQHYVTRLRINDAAARLRSSRDKLSLIAAEAGYRSLASFERSFKRHMGASPGEYRERCREWPL